MVMLYSNPSDQWNLIDWQIVNTKVHEMQTTIAEAALSDNLPYVIG